MNPRKSITGEHMSDCVVVFVTVGSAAEGERIAEVLVGERLAACVNIVGPIRSVYWWENAVQREEELLLIAKTRATQFAQIEARVRAVHSYATPEVIALPITLGSRPYVEWLLRETQPPEKQRSDP
jgi:periplasmic divalent cation tolerance protein